MPITVQVGNKRYDSTKSNHAEEVMFAVARNQTGNLEVTMNGWPCTGERNHNCHDLFISQSVGRIITVEVTDDHAGYARNHDLAFGATGTVTYNNGAVNIVTDP